MIKKVKGGWRVLSEHTHRNMGTSKTYKGAVKRLGQVEYFKHHKRK